MNELIKQTLIKLLLLFTAFSPLVCFIGTILIGTGTIPVLGFLSAQGLVNFWIVWIFCALGIFTADTIWFFVGRIEPLRKLKKIKILRVSYKKASKIIDKASHLKIFITMTLLKFMYLVAIPVIMSLGRRKRLEYKKFALYNALIITPWAGALAGLGWLAGQGYAIVTAAYENLFLSLTTILAAFIIIQIIVNRIKNWLFKKEHIPES